MNERIKELVKQAGGHFSTHTLTSYPAQHRESIELWDKNIEKFAKLIVRECIGCCEQVISDPVPKSVDTWLNGGIQCMAEIKQHFGVEE